MKKRVLMLAYHFPPDSSGGVPRTVQFVKYLRDFGWQSTVITPHWKNASGRDAGFGEGIPGDTEVVRVGIAEDEGRWWRMLDNLPYLWRWVPKLRGFLQYPGPFNRWVPPALDAARRILGEGRHQVIYSTSPPVVSHYCALQLKSELSIPWIADFRDPWTDNVLSYVTPFRWRRRIDLRLERRMCHAADMVIANTASNCRTLTAKHQVPNRGVAVITNGYDEEDFSDVRGARVAERFRITCTGSFYSPESVKTFGEAFKRFLAHEKSPNVVLTLAGASCRWAQAYMNDPAIQPYLELLGYVPHREACGLLVESDLLLMVYPEGIPYSVPGKLYEYLRSGRPIVAVCDRPSEVAALLERTGRGRALRHCEMEELSNYFSECYTRWKDGSGVPTRPCDEVVRTFDRRRLAERLAAILEGLAVPPSSVPAANSVTYT